jgi:HEAT repeat protein
VEENKSLLNKILKSFATQEGLSDLLGMSESHDGYKRENAVRRLGMLGNPIAIPRLIVRANDWVPQVREAAKRSLLQLLKNENATAFIISLPELHHLQKCGRDDHSELISKVTQFLVLPSNNSHVKSATESTDPFVARIAVKLCQEHALLNKQELMEKCLSHKDVVVRKIAAFQLREFNGAELVSYLEIAIKDPYMPIRREAFQIYAKINPEAGLAMAHRFLFDKSVSMRDLAIFYLKKNSIDVSQEFKNILESQIQSTLKVKCAILGLAMLNDKQYSALIVGFTRHNLPAIRKVSLQALVKLTGQLAKSFLLVGLKDESPNVTNEAARLLCKYYIVLSIEELEEVIEYSSYEHTLPACVSCTRIFNKWDRLIALLILYRFVMNHDAFKAELIEKELFRWNADFNRSSSQLTREKVVKLRDEYAKCNELLQDDQFTSLRFTLKSNGIAT